MDLTNLLNNLGIESPALINAILIAIQIIAMGIIALLTYIIISKPIANILIRLTKHTPSAWDDKVLTKSFFKYLGIFFAPILIKLSSSVIGWEYPKIIYQILDIWVASGSLLVISSLLDSVNGIYNHFSISKERPITVFIQVVKIILWATTIIIMISILIDKNPKTLLLSLGAFAAVLMLIFQNTILGLVAGIQLSANHMLRIGDWIEMPSSRADGDVIEINLTTVKVQNWDKTITTIPTHKLVSESFTNWRGMVESGGRRIKRSINIDIQSIRYLTEEDIQRLKESVLLKEYISQKLADLNEYNSNRSTLLDERRLTNIGTFREYMESWIASNPDINHNMTFMVRQLQPGPTGVPLEVYCFSARKAWVEYERVQADLFDHFYAIINLFGLKVFQYSGNIIENN